MRFLLDTNVISEAGKRKPDAKVLNWLQQHEANSMVPAIAIAERALGICLLSEPERSKRLEDFRLWVEDNSDRIASFDAQAGLAWGQYLADIFPDKKGVCDTQIAAIALAHNLIVVTRNTGDFPKVQTFNPWD